MIVGIPQIPMAGLTRTRNTLARPPRPWHRAERAHHDRVADGARHGHVAAGPVRTEQWPSVR